MGVLKEPRSHSASLSSSRCLGGTRVGVWFGVATGRVKAVSFVSPEILPANFFFGEWLLKYVDKLQSTFQTGDPCTN